MTNKPRVLIGMLVLLFCLALGYFLAVGAPQKPSDAQRALLKETVNWLETTHQRNLAQGKQAEWFNVYAYILYHQDYVAISDQSAQTGEGYAASHPCGCPYLSEGWVKLQNGVVISGLTAFWAFATPDLMVPLCIDLNGAKGPNQTGQDVYLGRLYNQKPNGLAQFDWQTPHYGCPGQHYPSIQAVIKQTSPTASL